MDLKQNCENISIIWLALCSISFLTYIICTASFKEDNIDADLKIFKEVQENKEQWLEMQKKKPTLKKALEGRRVKLDKWKENIIRKKEKESHESDRLDPDQSDDVNELSKRSMAFLGDATLMENKEGGTLLKEEQDPTLSEDELTEQPSEPIPIAEWKGFPDELKSATAERFGHDLERGVSPTMVDVCELLRRLEYPLKYRNIYYSILRYARQVERNIQILIDKRTKVC